MMSISPGYYVLITGPYDTTGVGPFPTMRAAVYYRATIDDTVFNTYVMDHTEFSANLDEFGLVPIQAPTH